MGSEGRIPRTFNSALDGGECSDSRIGYFTWGGTALDTNWTGNWEDPRDILNAVAKKRKLLPLPDIEPRHVSHTCVLCITV
jgi:hypothetical protein